MNHTDIRMNRIELRGTLITKKRTKRTNRRIEKDFSDAKALHPNAFTDDQNEFSRTLLSPFKDTRQNGVADVLRSVSEMRRILRRSSSRRSNQATPYYSELGSARSGRSLAHGDISRFQSEGEALLLFRKSAKMVQHALAWNALISRKATSIDSQLKTFLDVVQEVDSPSRRSIENEAGILFDPRDYHASMQVPITEELKTMMTLTSDCRTQKMIHKIRVSLQGLESYAEYPLQMQEKMAKVIWYQELPPKKMITRQGHNAENFYFIISGTALAKQFTKDELTGKETVQVLGRLQKGESFGEVALVHHSERKVTVETASHMQILIVSREDFLDIFFSQKESGEPEHVSFCRDITFLQNWPISKIREDTDSCLFHFFRKGTVVVQDSNSSNWIYIVKSGTCQVLKQLKKAHSQRPRTHLGGRSTLLQRSNSECFHEIVPRVDSWSQVGASQRNRSFSSSMSRQTTMYSSPSKMPTLIKIVPPDGSEASGNDSSKEDQTHHNWVDNDNFNVQNDNSSSLTTQAYCSTGYSKPKVSFLPPIFSCSSKPSATEEDLFRLHKSAGELSTEPQEHSCTKDPACFVQLRKLRPKDVFGLEEIRFPDDRSSENGDPSLILVSEGAELVMLSKSIFKRNATEACKKFIREKIRRFPSEVSLQESLQEKVNWDQFKKEVISDFLTRREAQKLLQAKLSSIT